MVATSARCCAAATVIADAVPGPVKPEIEGLHLKTNGSLSGKSPTSVTGSAKFRLSRHAPNSSRAPRRMAAIAQYQAPTQKLRPGRGCHRSRETVMPAQTGTQNLQITRAPDFAGVTISGLFRTSQGEQPAQDRRQAGSYSACSFFAARQVITARQAMALHLLVAVSYTHLTLPTN